ncbi:MAG: thioredoxin family protein [Candidatus Paceibacterota bacterium]|jgi:thiol-disulfide isomerase/thioredoxin
MKVIKIGAIWCQGCKIMGPRWKEIEIENPWLKTEFYDFDQNKEIVSKYNPTAMPSFIFLDKNDNEILRLSGEVDKMKIIEAINQNKDK